jgi:hypothetical protein
MKGSLIRTWLEKRLRMRAKTRRRKRWRRSFTFRRSGLATSKRGWNAKWRNMRILSRLSNWCVLVLATQMLRKWSRSSWLVSRLTSPYSKTLVNLKASMKHWKLAMRRRNKYCTTFRLKMTTKRSLTMLTLERRTEHWHTSLNSILMITSRRQSTSVLVRN